MSGEVAHTLKWPGLSAVLDHEWGRLHAPALAWAEYGADSFSHHLYRCLSDHPCTPACYCLQTLLPVIAAAHNSGGDAAGSPPRLPAAPSAPASSTPSAPAAPTAAPVLDQTPSMAVGKAVVDPKRKKRGRIAAMCDKGASVDWEGEQVKRRRAVQLDSLRVLPLLDSTQRSEPTADRQRILVTAGAHTYKRGTIVSFNKCAACAGAGVQCVLGSRHVPC